MLNENAPRIVRCTIEMELIEGEHFNISGMNLSNEDATIAATSSFVDTLQQMLDEWTQDESDDYIQTKIVEEKS